LLTLSPGDVVHAHDFSDQRREAIVLDGNDRGLGYRYICSHKRFINN
jgi:hypothetical protein